MERKQDFLHLKTWKLKQVFGEDNTERRVQQYYGQDR